MTKPISKWIRIVLPGALLIIWLSLGAIGGPYFGRIEEVASNDQSTFLPSSAESTIVKNQVEKFQDTSLLPAIIVFTDEASDKLGEPDLEAVDSALEAAKKATPSIDSVSPAQLAEDKQAILAVANLDSQADTDESIEAIKDSLDSEEVNLNYKITGPAGFSSDLARAFAGIDGLLLGVALSVVFVILVFVYRSPILPFIVLLNSVFALSAAILVVFYLAKADIIVLNGQVQGILFILVVGAATDYALLFVARYKEELTRHKQALQALLTTWKRSIEPIAAAGGTVIAGLLCLLLSDLNSNKALGPVGSIGIVAAITSALTLLPTLLYVFGRAAFWPRRPKYTKLKFNNSPAKQHGTWVKVANFVKSRPRLIWIVTVLILLAASAGLWQLKADGVPQSELSLGYSEAREGQEIIKKHFPGSSGTPVKIVVDKNNIQSTVPVIEADPSVDSVSVVADDSPSGTMPVGSYEDELRSDIRQAISQDIQTQKQEIKADIEASNTGAPAAVTDRIYQQAIKNIPSVDSLVDKAYPFNDSSVKVIDNQAVIEATLTDNPDSEAARQAVERIRSSLDKVSSDALVGGTTAVQLDTIKSAERDRMVVIPAVLVVITIILMLLLRSIAAPILLLLTTVLSFAAAIGVSAILFNHLWDFPGADPSVILYGFIFLVALGIDYNIFLMTRVREESLKSGTRKGVLNGLIVTGGVITSAGVVLAATFAALAVIPILFLAQLAFIVAFGVLLDTIVIRSILVPALVLDIGNKVWWPFAREIKD